jgi:hypothetical protein
MQPLAHVVPPRLARRGRRPAPQALSHSQVTPLALALALLELLTAHVAHSPFPRPELAETGGTTAGASESAS